MHSNIYELGLVLLAGQLIAEFLMFWRYVWPVRTQIVAISMILVGAATGLLLLALPLYLALPLLVVQTYRIFNLLRIIKGRVHQTYLRTAALRSSLVFGVLLMLIVALNYVVIANSLLLAALAAAQLLAAGTLAVCVSQQLRSSWLIAAGPNYSYGDLPTLTVAIPARNETAELSDCLHSLLKSDYPKLEILVIDDCSQDETSDIIRSFAHKGVRFIKGTPPGKNWLAKNWAYNQLSDEANGKLLLFCGVDVRFQPDTLRQLVGRIHGTDVEMLSVLPRRPLAYSRSSLLQPMRYWRELAYPRMLMRRPPVLSTCWLIKVSTLKKLGDFEAARQSIRPEHFFARKLHIIGKYRFYVNSRLLDITSVKSLEGQLQTAIRTRYPEMHRRPEAVFGWTIAQLLLFAGPFALAAAALFYNQPLYALAPLLAAALLLYVQLCVHRLAARSWGLMSALLFPVSILSELFTINYSMWRYEFSTVIWKGRNICLPVMQHLPRLPSI